MTPSGAHGGFSSAWHVDPVRARGLCLHLVSSSPHWGLSSPAWLAAGRGFPPHTLRWVSSAAGKGGARAFCTSPTGQGRPPCKFWKTGRTPATRGCRQEAVLDAGEKPGLQCGRATAQAPCLPPGVREPCRTSQGPQGARQAHHAFQEPASGSGWLHKWSLTQWGEPLSTENIKLRQLFPKPAGFINTRFYF